MEHLNATDQNNTVVNPEQFVLSAVTVMNLLAQMEWRAIGLVILASILVIYSLSLKCIVRFFKSNYLLFKFEKSTGEFS